MEKILREEGVKGNVENGGLSATSSGTDQGIMVKDVKLSAGSNAAKVCVKDKKPYRSSGGGKGGGGGGGGGRSVGGRSGGRSSGGGGQRRHSLDTCSPIVVVKSHNTFNVKGFPV